VGRYEWRRSVGALHQLLARTTGVIQVVLATSALQLIPPQAAQQRAKVRLALASQRRHLLFLLGAALDENTKLSRQLRQTRLGQQLEHRARRGRNDIKLRGHERATLSRPTS
jgi:hypothetical protein